MFGYVLWQGLVRAGPSVPAYVVRQASVGLRCSARFGEQWAYGSFLRCLAKFDRSTLFGKVWCGGPTLFGKVWCVVGLRCLARFGVW